MFHDFIQVLYWKLILLLSFFFHWKEVILNTYLLNLTYLRISICEASKKFWSRKVKMASSWVSPKYCFELLTIFVRPPTIEMLVIIIFYCQNLMYYTTIINHHFLKHFLLNKKQLQRHFFYYLILNWFSLILNFFSTQHKQKFNSI